MNHIRFYIMIAIAAGGLFLLTSNILHAQEAAAPAPAPAPAAAAPTGAETEKKEEKPSKDADKTFLELLKQGGVMMIFLGLASVVMVALVFDGFRRLRNSKLAPPDLLNNLRMYFQSGDYSGAYQTCKSRPSFLTNVVRAGLSMLGHGKDATQGAMEETIFREASGLHTRIRYLSVIGVISPMLGLTGTVLGMIRAFSTLGHSGIGDPSALAAAIGEVLVATATGLFVAVPSFIFYYVFGNRVTATTSYAEEVITGLFRGMPYDQMGGVLIGDEPIYAAAPSPMLLVQRGQPSMQMPGMGGTAHCPTCQVPVPVGTPICPSCHTTLTWGTA